MKMNVGIFSIRPAFWNRLAMRMMAVAMGMGLMLHAHLLARAKADEMVIMGCQSEAFVQLKALPLKENDFGGKVALSILSKVPGCNVSYHSEYFLNVRECRKVMKPVVDELMKRLEARGVSNAIVFYGCLKDPRTINIKD